METYKPEHIDTDAAASETLEQRAARKAAKREAKARAAARETADHPPSESTDQAPADRAVQRPREQRGGIPRAARMTGAEDYSRARPRQKPVRVLRAWPGVTTGQLVVLHPQHQKRLLRGGFVEEV